MKPELVITVGMMVDPETIDLLADLVAERLLDREDAAAPPAETPPATAEPADRLPWSFWAPELRTRLKDLAGRFPANAIADCAAELAALIAEHGPNADEAIAQLDADDHRRR